MIRFGPAGNSDSFYDSGYKHTTQAPMWLDAMGLRAFEYSFGKGVKLSEKTGEAIFNEAQKYDVALSAHAVYFINLAAEDEERKQKNIGYFLQCAQGAKRLHASRLIFHPGAVQDGDRALAMKNAKELLGIAIRTLDEHGFGDIALCPETMGKKAQLGDLAEVLELCGLDERIIPAIDFGHLHARDLGALKEKADFARIIDEMINKIGFERTRDMHVHFSKIEFTNAGERRHRVFSDEGFGPDFEPFLQVVFDKKLEPRVICESKGTMAEDAKTMRDYYCSLAKEC